MSQTSLTQGDVKGALIRFALPFLGASLLQFLYGAVISSWWASLTTRRASLPCPPAAR